MLGCRWFLPMVVEVCPALPLPAAGLPTVLGAKAGTAESVLVPDECQEAMSATWWETEWGKEGLIIFLLLFTSGGRTSCGWRKSRESRKRLHAGDLERGQPAPTDLERERATIWNVLEIGC